ncbi:WD repeat-containing protein 26 homolog [Dendrobium catenatum]|uniref:Putative cytosolic iron-sulfur protein assembly protein CIAO1 like n=1 Tax=Dendrobium catenatum TaxID=906689 RepID=A0A2I0W511_9ASPA|nr:WD repeat-containing protein 26 homolog [Dendrobium catenatum]PKU70743.1 putative cytosolic iron-sulfur protein assembly protein CIAO1 like [Dendrobium catenatum]
MGRIDDREPPSKRVKETIAGLQGFSNSIPSPANHIDPLGGQMARPLTPHGNKDMIGSKGIIKRSEFVRIITKALYSLGYDRSGAILEEESGIPLHSPLVDCFRKQVLDGNWDGSLATLNKISISDDVLKLASFMILEYKFCEFLEMDRVLDAVNTLRNEITPLRIKPKRVHELSACIICPSLHLSLGSINGIKKSSSRLNLLNELQKVLPPALMIPEGRLEHLIEQALNVQREACYFHNSLDSCLTLYTDHHCREDQIPSQTTQVLQGHGDEVWFVQFSNNGKLLASSSRDNSAIIWEVREDGVLSLKHTLTGHQKPVLMISWSPDDSQLLTCGLEEVVRRWDISSGECVQVYEKIGVGLISCGWFPDGKRFFSGVTDSSICLWDLDGKELECWNGQRMIKTSDLTITGDGKQIISMCRESAILVLEREAKVEKLIEENHTITSFSLSRDDQFLLVNLINQEIHLWDITGFPKLVMSYKGHKRSRFVIRSCFGGYEQSYIASGSEDSQVYIWHRSSGYLIAALPGHTGAVNCVSWNPVNPQMLASASDDHSIRIWGGSMVNLNHKEAYSNGVCQSNGNK